MAESSKPAARKKTTAKRGPTKAAALKALGISQEDLDLIKQVAEARRAAEETERELVQKTEAQQEAKAETYKNLAEQGEPVPADIAAEAAPTTDQTLPSGPWFVRNLRNVEVGLRLERMDKGKKRLDLKARGERGDIKPIKDEDLNDSILLNNLGLTVEIITAGEAAEIIKKQAINQQQQVHPAMAILRNALGEKYEQTEVPVVGDNSYTVAHLQPQGGEAGALPSSGRGIDWAAVRNSNLGGNPAIISDGYAAADAIARRKDIQGPAAGLGGLNVAPIGEVEKN